jgi:hypothetical protein
MYYKAFFYTKIYEHLRTPIFSLRSPITKKTAYNRKKVKTRAQALLRNTPCFYLFSIVISFLAIGGSEKIAFSS